MTLDEIICSGLHRFPVPIADALLNAGAAGGSRERRDRIVEAFRASVRLAGAIALAVRVQFGPGNGGDGADVLRLLKKLRRQSLTDGEWVGLTRELLRPWAGKRDHYPVAGMVGVFHGNKRVSKSVDGLLAMRKAETVAHGQSGEEEWLREVLTAREPQLVTLVQALGELWSRYRLAVSLARPHGDERQRAWLAMGCTPLRGKWLRAELAAGLERPPNEVLLVDEAGKAAVVLHPVVLFERPSPEAVESLFLLDGSDKKSGGARYVSLPSAEEHTADEPWAFLEDLVERGDGEYRQSQGVQATEPFRGLLSFGPDHVDLFFGRDQEIEQLANRVRRHGFVTVTGPSGCGKTSLLQAGVLPRLTDDFDHLVLRPGTAPATNLAARAADLCGETVDAASPAGLVETLTRWCARRVTEEPESEEQNTRGLVLVVDQAEELFTLCRDAEERDRFGAALAALGSSADGPLRVVLSIRGDFFSRPAEIDALRGLYDRVVQSLATPGKEALRRTLEGPLERFSSQGDRYGLERDEQGDLAEEMIASVEGEPAALALLQFCASRLWERRDRKFKRLLRRVHDEIGGVPGALADHATVVYESLSPSHQWATRDVLLRLVTREHTRASVERTEIESSTPDPNAANAVIDALLAADARLLVAREGENGEGGGRIELVHEALITHWPKLGQWLEDDQLGHGILAGLQADVAHWASRGRHRTRHLWTREKLEEYRFWHRRSGAQLRGDEARFVQLSNAALKRRIRVVATIAITVFVAMAGLAGWAVWGMQEADRQRARAEASDRKSTLTLARIYDADVKRALDASRVRDAAIQALRVLKIADTDLGRFAANEALENVTLDALALWHEEEVSSVAFSPDGKFLASGGGDNNVRLWSVAKGEVARVLTGHEGAVNSVNFSPDGRLLASGGDDNTVRLWSVATGATEGVLTGHEGAINSVNFSPDDKLVASGGDDNTVRLWSVGNGEIVRVLTGHGSQVTSVEFSPGGEVLASSGGADKTVALWSIETWQPIWLLDEHEGAVNSVAFSPDGKLLASGSGGDENTVRLWSVETGEVERVMKAHSGLVNSVAFSPDGKLLASGSWDDTVRLWSVETGESARELKAHSSFVNSVAFSPDGKLLASGSLDDTARLWTVRAGLAVRVFEGRGKAVYSVAFSPSGRLLAAGCSDGPTLLWSLETGEKLRALGSSTNADFYVAFSPDGKLLASGGWHDTIRLWSVETGEQVRELTGHNRRVRSLTFSPDGRLLASVGNDSMVRLWSVEAGEIVRVLKGQQHPVRSVEFSPNGKLLASRGLDDTVRLWSVETGKAVRVLKGHQDFVESVAFSQDGELLASGSDDHTVRLWSVETGETVRVLKGHQDAVGAVTFSPDGRLLATGSIDHTVRLWSVESGEQVRTLTAHEDTVESVAFSPDGRLLASGSSDDTVRLWSVNRFGDLDELRERLHTLVSCGIRYDLDQNNEPVPRDPLEVALDRLAAVKKGVPWYSIDVEHDAMAWANNELAGAANYMARNALYENKISEAKDAFAVLDKEGIGERKDRHLIAYLARLERDWVAVDAYFDSLLREASDEEEKLDVHWEYAAWLEEDEEHERAAELMRRVYLEYPDDLDVANGYGWQLILTGKGEEARALFERLLKLVDRKDTHYPFFLGNLANAYLLIEAPVKAEELYRQGLGLELDEDRTFEQVTLKDIAIMQEKGLIKVDTSDIEAVLRGESAGRVGGQADTGYSATQPIGDRD